MNSRIKTAAKFGEELHQSNKKSDTKKEGYQHIKAKFREFLKKKWESKVMHGQYIRSMDRQLIGEEDMCLRLLSGDVKGDSESEITAAQDQALQNKCYATKYYTHKRILKADSVNNLMRHIEHILACPILAKEEYIKRHDRVCAQLHLNIRKKTGVKLDNEH